MPDSVSADALQLLRLILDTPLMRELSVAEQRYQAVLAVISDGLSVSQVAEKVGVSRQTLHSWLARYEAEGLEGLVDRSHRPVSCPHQMPAAVEAAVLELRRSRPYWGAAAAGVRVGQAQGVAGALGVGGVSGVAAGGDDRPGSCGIGAHASGNAGNAARPMELWQMDVVGGFPLADGTSAKALTGIDDHSRMCVCAAVDGP